MNSKKLHDVTKVVVSLIIDVNYYSISEARRSNMRHRLICHGALEANLEMAERDGPYET
jgi:hypothetical protein